MCGPFFVVRAHVEADMFAGNGMNEGRARRLAFDAVHSSATCCTA
jgi:hypothetical protein